jgi:hypothetical protein
MNIWFAEQIGREAVHGLDSLVSVPAAIDTMKAKWRQMGLSATDIAKGVTRAQELTRLNPNVTIAENMELLTDARTNLIGSWDEILGEVGAFSKLAGFFKAWDGGKHAGAAHDLMAEIGKAIRSGELAGNTSGAELAKHADALARMKVLYGDRLNVGQYFTAQKAAGAIFPALSDTFKFTDFPALVNDMGSRAGVGLLTLMNKVLAGINVRDASANEWNRLGMVDTSKVHFKKGGGIDAKAGLATGWLKDTDLLGQNPIEWLMRSLVPHLEGSVRGLHADRIVKEWQAGDAEALAHDLRRMNRADLFAELGKLGYDRTAVQEMLQGITRAPMILRDRANMAKIRAQIEDFKSYDKAKQEVGTAANTLFQALTGQGFVPAVTSALQGLAGAMNIWADIIGNGEGWKKLKNVDVLNPPKGSPLSDFMIKRGWQTDDQAKAALDRYNGTAPKANGYLGGFSAEGLKLSGIPFRGAAPAPLQAGPVTNNNQKITNAPITINQTINVTQTNASPEAIGNAAGSIVGNKVRGALHDGGNP